MKILMLGWELPPYNSGGLGVACFQLAKALSAQGADIEFVLPPTASHDPSAFMKVYSVPLNKTSELLDGDTSGYSDDVGAVRRLQDDYARYVVQHIKTSKPDVIHANDWLTLEAGVIAKKLSGTPLVAHVHATEYDRSGGGDGNPIIHEIERHGLMMADHIVAVSEATKRLIIDKYAVPANKIEVIHNGSEVLASHQTDMVEYAYVERLKAEGFIVVATIGRLTVQKGFKYFLRAAAKASHVYPRFIFLVAGDGELRDELIAESADLGISDSVLFTGFVRGKAWRDVYNLADVFVMSSVSEPFGLTALEAAQHGTAITMTNQCGVREVLKNVLSYDYWDEDRLADQLVSLALSGSLRSVLSNNAMDEVRHLSWVNVADKFMSRYYSLEVMRT